MTENENEYGLPTTECDGIKIIDVTPLLIKALQHDEGWPIDLLSERMADIIGDDWSMIPAWEWGERLEAKGMMQYDEKFSRDVDPWNMEFWMNMLDINGDRYRNESVYEAVVRLIGHGPGYKPEQQDLFFIEEI